MASELERIAGRLRFLSDQAQKHRAPVIDVARKLHTAAVDVRGLVVDRPDGGRDVPPPAVVGQLEDAARNARAAEGTLKKTADLLRVFAATLASGGGGVSAGRSPAGEGYRPDDAGDPTAGGDPALPGDPGAPATSGQGASGQGASGPTAEAGSAAEGGLPPSPRGGRTAPSRYGRYPTSTAARFSPGNRSYEVGT